MYVTCLGEFNVQEYRYFPIVPVQYGKGGEKNGVFVANDVGVDLREGVG